MKYTTIWGAGAGDQIRSFYWDGQYAALEELGPNDTCGIFLPSLNPASHEFFSWHPAREKLNVVQLPYFTPDQDEEMRRKYGVPMEGDYIPLPRSTKPVVFYPSPKDNREISEVGIEMDRQSYDDYIVFSSSAGTPDRNLSGLMISECYQAIEGYYCIATGRIFDRGDGRGEVYGDADRTLINRLSLPGTCKLLEGASGLVTCHSALSMLAFLIHKPQLLLYPEEVRHRHFLQPDMWSFGASESICVHGTFEDFEKNGAEMVDRFLQAMKAGSK